MTYIDTVDIERLVEKNFVLALRAIFENDNSFVYNEDDTKTGIMITPEYPPYNNERTIQLSLPYLVITDITYQFSRDTSLSNNFSESAWDTSGFMVGEKKYSSIPYNLSILCFAEEFAAKDLANKVVGYIMHTWEDLFDSIHMNVRTASKGSSRLQSQYPNKIYQVPISISGVAYWTGLKMVQDKTKLDNILNRIEEMELTLLDPKFITE